MVPAARTVGYLPVYIDVWQSRSDVLAAINYGLQEAIDDLEVPTTTVGRRLRTKINKVGVAAMSLELRDEPTRKRPESPYLLIDWLLKSLVDRARRCTKAQVFLLFQLLGPTFYISSQRTHSKASEDAYQLPIWRPPSRAFSISPERS
jgi:hypothetical protein